MIHGFRGTHHGLLKIANALGDKYNLIIPDLPGFGASQPFKNHKNNLESYVNFLKNFIKFFDFKTPPNLLAHSFGTIIASAYVAQNPNAVDKLILLSPIAELPMPKPVTYTLLPIVKLLHALPEKPGAKLTGNKLVADVMSLYTTKTKDPELKKWIKAEHRRYFNTFATNKAMTEAMRTSILNYVAQFARQIPNQTLIIYGDKDNVGKTKKQQNLGKFFPHAQSKTIRGTGHLTPYEMPDAVAEAVNKFI